MPDYGRVGSESCDADTEERELLGVQELLRQAGFEVTLERLKEALDNDAPDPHCSSCGETGARCTKCFLEYIQRG